MELVARPVQDVERACIAAHDKAIVCKFHHFRRNFILGLRVAQPALVEEKVGRDMKAFTSKNFEQIMHMFTELESDLFGLLASAQSEGLIKGQLGPEFELKEVTKSYMEYCAELDEFLMCEVMFLRSEKAKAETRMREFVNRVSAETQVGADSRLRALLYCFNSEPATSPFKAWLMEMIVKFAGASGLFEPAIAPKLASLKEWIGSWSIPDEDKKRIYVSVAVGLKATKRSTHEWMLCAMRCMKAPFSPEDLTIAEDCLAEMIKWPTTFYFDKIVNIEVVATQLKNSVVFKIAEILLRGSPDELNDFFAKNSDAEKALAKHDIKRNLLSRKMNTIAVAAEAADMTTKLTPSITIEGLAQKVGLKVDETEEACVSAIGYKILDAKLNQLDKRIEIRSGMIREVTRDDWIRIQERIASWKHIVST